MSNMSYCRFQNTLRDLRECDEALDEIEGDLSQLSQDEQYAAKWLIELCQRIGSIELGGAA